MCRAYFQAKFYWSTLLIQKQQKFYTGRLKCKAIDKLAQSQRAWLTTVTTTFTGLYTFLCVHFMNNNLKTTNLKITKIIKRLLARSLLFLSESTQIRPTRVFFLSSFSRNFDDQLSPNFHRLVILWLYWSLTITKHIPSL